MTELSYFNVYSDTYDKIKESYGKKSLLKWYYRTIILQTDTSTSEIHEYGPFTTDQIKSWIDQKLLDDTDKIKIKFKITNDNNINNDWLTIDSPDIKQLLV